jgi:hypothetical protein
MRRFAELALKLVTAGGTVFIAACYGVMYDRTAGRVIDSGSRLGIPGIEVGCLNGTETIAVVTTDAGGDFLVSATCTELVVTDVDGPTNGSYVGKTVPVIDGYMDIELDPQP